MALLADVRDSFGSSQRYVVIRDYRVDRATGMVAVRAEIYADAATRERYKAADAALIDLHAQVTAKQAEIQSAIDDFRALTYEEQAGRRDAFNASLEAMRVAAEALKSNESTQRAALDANRPGKQDNFDIPPGGVPVAATGAVLLSDIYTWLAANPYPGASAA